MRLDALCPVVATERLAETRDFYLRLGFVVTAERPGALELASPAGQRLGFLAPGRDRGRPPALRSAFRGRGLCFALAVADADREYDRAMLLGLPIAQGLRDEPRGERRFALVDPNGILLEFTQTLAPAEPAGGRRRGKEAVP